MCWPGGRRATTDLLLPHTRSGTSASAPATTTRTSPLSGSNDRMMAVVIGQLVLENLGDSAASARSDTLKIKIRYRFRLPKIAVFVDGTR
jgi:hypothetical protein